MNIELPNGQVITGLPEDIDPDEVLKLALGAGLLSQEEVGRMKPQSFAQQNIVPLLPELTATGGALAGAALGTAAFPVLGTVAGALAGSAIGAFTGGGFGESLRQLLQDEDPDVLRAVGEASKEGSLDLVGGKFFDAIGATKNLVMKSLGYGPRDMSEKKIIQELQNKLERDYGTTLRGSQVDPTASIVKGVESAAEQAIGSRNSLEAIAEVQNKYLDDQIDGLIQVSSKLEGESLGTLVKNLVENARVGASETFGQMFKELDQAGKGVQVSLQGPRNRARAWRSQKAEGLTKRMQEKIDAGARIPFTSAQIQKAVDDVLTLSPNTSFSNAFGKLKDLKQRLTAMRGDPATANDPAVAELTMIVKGFEESLLKSTRKVDPQLAKTYEKLMKEYEKTQNVLFSDVAVRMMKQGNPEEIGRMLSKPGQVTPVKEIRKIIKEAKKLGVKEGGDILKGIRKGFLAKNLASAEGQGMATLASFKKKLADPDFARTFNELVPEAEKKKLYNLLQEAEILNRGVGGEFSLAVRSAQLAGAQGVIAGGGNAGLIANLAKVLTPAKMAEAVASPETARQMLGMIKTANKYVGTPEKMPPQVARAFATHLANLSAVTYGNVRDQEFQQTAQPMLEELRAMQ